MPQQKSLQAARSDRRAKPNAFKAKQKTPVVRLLVWDGNWYIHRAHHAFGMRRLVSRSGEDVSILYGFLQLVAADLRRFRPTHALVVFDGQNSAAYRCAIYPAYKANRRTEDASATLVDNQSLVVLEQQAKIVHALSLLGIQSVAKREVEGDDLLAAVVHQFGKSSKLIICTGDKDMAVLVRPGVKLFNSMTRTMYDEDGIREHYGVRPHQMTDYLCMLGDSTDNVPGCPQVGKVNAIRILHTYGSVDLAVKSGKEPRIATWVKNGGYELAKSLISLRSDLVLPFGLDEMHIRSAVDGARQQLADSGLKHHHPWVEEHLSGKQTSTLFRV